MIKSIEKIQNGVYQEDFTTYSCDRCEIDLPECDPHVRVDCGDFCPDCAFIKGIINEQECKKCGYYWYYGDFSLEIVDGLVFTVGPGQKGKKKDRRNSIEYSEWRKSVFKRDNYTCTSCSNVGGVLNAHHIKPYKYFPESRLDIDNGQTLCRECHKVMHYGVKHEVV